MKKMLPLILIIVTGAFFAFWYFQIREDKPANTQNNSQDNQVPSPTQLNENKNNYLVINEWGIKYLKPESAPDVNYEIDSQNKTINIFSPKLNELTSEISECSQNKNISVVSRAQPGDKNFGSVWTLQALEEIGKKIGQYYYYLEKSDFCNPQAESLSSEAQIIIRDLSLMSNDPRSSL